MGWGIFFHTLHFLVISIKGIIGRSFHAIHTWGCPLLKEINDNSSCDKPGALIRINLPLDKRSIPVQSGINVLGHSTLGHSE